jgi:hypothetical protein
MFTLSFQKMLLKVPYCEQIKINILTRLLFEITNNLLKLIEFTMDSRPSLKL